MLPAHNTKLKSELSIAFLEFKKSTKSFHEKSPLALPLFELHRVWGLHLNLLLADLVPIGRQHRAVTLLKRFHHRTFCFLGGIGINALKKSNKKKSIDKNQIEAIYSQLSLLDSAKITIMVFSRNMSSLTKQAAQK